MLVKHGHKVIIEKSAECGSGIKDEDYIKAGAEIYEKNTDVLKKPILS